MKTLWKIGIAAASLAVPSVSATAQSSITTAPQSDYLLEEYVGVIGPQDLYNSDGARLTKPWQIIRQDRANYHLFGRRDAADGSDTFFSSRGNRAKLEKMLAVGFISQQAARDIVEGGAFVRVQILGRGATGHSVQIEVVR